MPEVVERAAAADGPNADSMRVLIIGCGRVGAELALALCNECLVTIVDQKGEAFDQLGPDFRGRTVEGEGFDPAVLRRAGIEAAGALAAVTSSDSVNVVAARLARDTFRVPRVVARVYNPRRLSIYETFHIDTVVSTTWGAQRIAQMLLDPPLAVVSAVASGEVHLVEVRAPASWSGRELESVFPDASARVAAITRGGHAYLPASGARLEAGDRLLVSLTKDGLLRLRSDLGLNGQGGS
jgi:trk system potassium uptake protein TrkA